MRGEAITEHLRCTEQMLTVLGADGCDHLVNKCDDAVCMMHKSTQLEFCVRRRKIHTLAPRVQNSSASPRAHQQGTPRTGHNVAVVALKQKRHRGHVGSNSLDILSWISHGLGRTRFSSKSSSTLQMTRAYTAVDWTLKHAGTVKHALGKVRYGCTWEPQNA